MEVQESFILRILMIIVIYLSTSKAESNTNKITRSWNTANLEFGTLDVHKQKEIPLETTNNPLSQKALIKTKITTTGVVNKIGSTRSSLRRDFTSGIFKGNEEESSFTYSVTLIREDGEPYGFAFKGTKIGRIDQDTPASKNGILSLGDNVSYVNGVKTTSYEEVVDQIKRSGLSVNLTLQRPRYTSTLRAGIDLSDEKATKVDMSNTKRSNYFSTTNGFESPFSFSNYLTTSSKILETSNKKSFLEKLRFRKSMENENPQIIQSTSFTSSEQPNDVSEFGSTYSGLSNVKLVTNGNDTTENETLSDDDSIVSHIALWTQSVHTATESGITSMSIQRSIQRSRDDSDSEMIQRDPDSIQSIDEIPNVTSKSMADLRLNRTSTMTRDSKIEYSMISNVSIVTAAYNSDEIDITHLAVIKGDCTCKDLKNKNGVGNCKGSKPKQFNGTTVACYVNLPSTCGDLKDSVTNPGEQLSADLCKSMSQHRSSEETASMLQEAHGRGILSATTNLNSTLDDTNDKDNILNINIETPTSSTTTRHKSTLRIISNHHVTSAHTDDEKQNYNPLDPTSNKIENDADRSTNSYPNLSYSTIGDAETDGKISLKQNTTNETKSFTTFWTNYIKRFLKVLRRSRYELNDAPVRFFVRRQLFPQHSIINLMYPEKNKSARQFKRCVLFRRCLSIKKDKNPFLNDSIDHKNEQGAMGRSLKSIPESEPCSEKNEYETCPKNTIRFELLMVGWGSGQYAPIHDNPKEGSLINIVQGPGLLESTFWKPPESDIEHYDLIFDKALDTDYMSFGDETQFYSCYSYLQDQDYPNDAHGCEEKNQTTSYITRTKSYNLTRGGNYQIRFHKGFNRLHALKNVDKSETTLTLHHTLGDNRISWWLNNLNETKLFE